MKKIDQAIDKILESKTYSLLILVAFIALGACLIAAVFGEMLWAKYLDFLSIQSGLGGARALTNDGVPKIVEAYKKPDLTIPIQAVAPPDPNQFPVI